MKRGKRAVRWTAALCALLCLPLLLALAAHVGAGGQHPWGCRDSPRVSSDWRKERMETLGDGQEVWGPPRAQDWGWKKQGSL